MTAQEISAILTCFRKNWVGKEMRIAERRGTVTDVQLDEGSSSFIWHTEGDFTELTLCTALGDALWLVSPPGASGTAPCPEPTVGGLALSGELKRVLGEIGEILAPTNTR